MANTLTSVLGGEERPKHAIAPHTLDYYDTCAKIKEKICATQTTLNCIWQSGSASIAKQNGPESMSFYRVGDS